MGRSRTLKAKSTLWAKPYKGKHYSELNWKDRCHFKNYSVSRAETGKDEITQEKKLRYFLKLNTSGKPQDQEHMEKVKKMLAKEKKK